MSRPQKKHKRIKGDFNNILAAIGLGSGKGRKAAGELALINEKQTQANKRKKS